MNGLWANSLGLGGIIPIECNWFPSSKFLDLKLTGMQGDVMKESMNVAKTLAWNLTPPNIRTDIFNEFKENNCYGGIHIHCPEGAVPKDGPSAGTAITVALYSLINMKKIKNNIAITGEINLQGSITAIGGLEIKILGGIRAGVKEFIYPHENKKSFNEFMEKYKDTEYVQDIKFHIVKKIEDVLKLVFV
jgi:ATP-dependent Lon protease